MRIVAGEWRGRALEAPEGDGTRPTVDRVREALFSSLFSQRGGFEDAVVLDAFAGSGALGLEALSRGAASAVFYERDARAFDTCKRNCQALGVGTARACCVKRDVMKTPPLNQQPPFNLVFLDPPYAYQPQQVLEMVQQLLQQGAAQHHALFVYEHAYNNGKEVTAALEQAGFCIVSAKRYGKTGVTLFKEQ